MWVRRWAVVDWQHSSPPPLDDAQADVGGDRVQPRAYRAPTLELVEPAPCSQKGLLNGVLDIVNRTEHLVAVRVQGGAVGLELFCVRAVVRGHRFCCQSATSPPAGVATTERQPAGPSRGSRSNDAPRPSARSVAISIPSTSTYGSHAAGHVPHSTIPPSTIAPPGPSPSNRAR